MGVYGLWDILEENKIGTTRSLKDLRNETLAVDLAPWICQSEAVGSTSSNVETYIRNLISRVVKLIRGGVKLVFVIDGKPPLLKQQTIANRSNTRFSKDRGFSGITCSRNELDARLKKCCEVLEHLGIPCLKADGEAEATCAVLNLNRNVDACITNDSDVFLYGARKVYKNITFNKQEATVDCYEMKNIWTKLKLNRDSFIAMALLTGCDYTVDGKHGVPGIGKVKALKLLNLWQGKNALQALRDWKTKPKPEIPCKLLHCTVCKHLGTKNKHFKGSCDDCGRDCADGKDTFNECNCPWHLHQNESIEDEVWLKAQKVDGFPPEEIIQEFKKPRNVKEIPRAHAPCLDGLMKCLQWTPDFIMKTVLPLLTYRALSLKEKSFVEFIGIEKMRILNRREIYDVKWLVRGYGEHVSPEPRQLVKAAHPDVVKKFSEDLEKKRNVSKIQNASTGSKKMTDFFKQKKRKFVPDKGNTLDNQSADDDENKNLAKELGSSSSVIDDNDVIYVQ
ncbi:flap endonuclease GEN homolog 1-like isoform X1 [Clavelina lepadiformis]|uniref:flap endonuclease GEN homolog 1-like isoform X1 n=1 Tax=Clavelina lepadiformis TaxID=159417 RepID=UPI004042D27D